MKKSIYFLISRSRKNRFTRHLRRIVSSLYDALENKNDDQHTNGEFWLMQRLSSLGNLVVFDVGANIGKWSLAARKIFGSSLIYAFEPMPPTFAKLQVNVAKDEFIQVFNSALTNEKGLLNFNYYPDASFFSSLFNNLAGGKSISMQVEGLDGDSFCQDKNIDQIDFLKIDVEGTEHLVLDGFKKMLREQKIKVIQFEYGALCIDSKFLLKDYYQLLTSYGYTLGKLFPNHINFCLYDWTMENFICSNYVAVKNSEVELINSLK